MSGCFIKSIDRLVLCISAVSFPDACKPCPHDANRFRPTLFIKVSMKWKLLFTLNVPRVHIALKCDTAHPHKTPATRATSCLNEQFLMTKIQKDKHTEIPAFITDENIFSPHLQKLRTFYVDYYRSFKAQKLVFGPALLWTLTSAPSSEPVGVVSFEAEAAGVDTDWLLFSSAGLVSDGRGTPNASSTCVMWTQKARNETYSNVY